MKCFYHRETDAVALCKSCSRALCPDCAADVPPGSACRNRCEQDVAAVNLMIERNKSVYQKARIAHKRNAIATLILGLIFIVMGVLPIILIDDWYGLFMVIFGFAFFLWAYFSYKNGEQIESAERCDEHKASL